MRLKILGSSSDGNCYLLQSQTETLMIECGLTIDKIKQGLNFNTRNVCGCLISHEHKDHCKSVVDVMKAGIKVFATPGTFDAMNINTTHHRAFAINPLVNFKIGSFKILPFKVKHDAKEPVGFLIDHPESGKILFVTDTHFVRYNFPGLNNIIVEANYSTNILKGQNGDHDFLKDRIMRSHMSLETCKELLLANDLTGVNNIVLIHLSDRNSDAARFKKEVQAVTGKMTHIAEPNLILEFNKTAF